MLVTSFALSFGMEEANDDELDASIVASVPSNSTFRGLETPLNSHDAFRGALHYCDDVTLEDMEVKKKLDKKDGGVEVHIGFQLRVRPQKNDKVIELEFALLNGERELQLERIEDIEINAGKDEDESFSFDMSRDNFAEFTAEGAAPQLRVSMIVLND